MKRDNHVKLNVIEVAATFNKNFQKEYGQFENYIREMAEGGSVKAALRWPGASMIAKIKFRHASFFLDEELTSQHVVELRDEIFRQLYPVLKQLTPELIHTVVKAVLESLPPLLADRKIMKFDELLKQDFRVLLVSSIHMKSAVELNSIFSQTLLNKPVLAEHADHECMFRTSFRPDQPSASQPKFTVTQWISADMSDREYEESLNDEFEDTCVHLKRNSR